MIGLCAVVSLWGMGCVLHTRGVDESASAKRVRKSERVGSLLCGVWWEDQN